MHPRLEELHQDHVNLAKVLRVLDSQLAEVRAGEHVNLNLLSEIVDYVESYPDLIHHQRENVIFSVYLERCGGGSGLIEGLMAEHGRLLGKTHEIREHIQQWWIDSPVPRQRVVAVIEDYLQMQWNHLNLEEEAAFDLLNRELADDDWQRIDASTPAASDPLFGKLLRQRFVSIFEQLGL